MPLPHDFRAAARQPIPVNGKGAPLQVSGTNLQENFEYLDKKATAGGNVLPSGQSGDMLYHDGFGWFALVNPGEPQSEYKWVLLHDGFEPSFVEHKQIIVDICEDGTPTSYTILGIPTV